MQKTERKINIIFVIVNLKKYLDTCTFGNPKEKKRDGMKSEQIKTVLLFFFKKRD